MDDGHFNLCQYNGSNFIKHVTKKPKRIDSNFTISLHVSRWTPICFNYCLQNCRLSINRRANSSLSKLCKARLDVIYESPIGPTRRLSRLELFVETTSDCLVSGIQGVIPRHEVWRIYRKSSKIVFRLLRVVSNKFSIVNKTRARPDLNNRL